MIHWMISSVTSALCFQRSPISFSKTEFKQCSVVTPASRPTGLLWTQLTANTAAFTAALLFVPWTQPSQHCYVRGHLASQTKTNTFPHCRGCSHKTFPPLAATGSAQSWLSSAACRTSWALSHFQWEKGESCSEMNHINVVIRLLCLCSHRQQWGFSPPGLH